jgi:predicted RNA-binding protein YlxR (DUF448 family)
MNTTKKKSNTPIRRCLITGEQLPKQTLIRMVLTPQGQLLIDPSGKLNGRGAYLKKNIDLIERLKKGQYLKKQFAVEVTDDFYDQLKKAMCE